MDSVWINGVEYQLDPIYSGKTTGLNGGVLENKVLSILYQWKTGQNTFVFRTSGSTGKPKSIILQRKQIEASARATLNELNIQKGFALNCLDPEYIAGFMMIIRAITGNLKLLVIDPTSNPLLHIPQNIDITLSAMVPMQLKQSLENSMTSRIVDKIEHLLVGGADVSDDLIKKMQNVKATIYHTFGMTETVSHVALRQLNGVKASGHYTVLPGIRIKRDHRGCLIVRGTITNDQEVITNDLVEITGASTFKWIGRIDLVINSGGIKIMVEHLEKKIKSILLKYGYSIPFFITGIPDPLLGEKISIVFASEKPIKEAAKIKEALTKKLDRYEVPRDWNRTEKFYYTDSGKIDRLISYKHATPID